MLTGAGADGSVAADWGSTVRSGLASASVMVPSTVPGKRKMD